MAITYVGGAHNGTNSTGSHPSITHGLSLQEDDVCILLVHNNQNVTTTSDDGATEDWNSTGTSLGSNATFYIFSYVCGASPPATFSFTNLVTTVTWSVQIRAYRGVDTSSKWDVAPTNSTSNWDTAGTTKTANAITLTSSDAWAIATYVHDTDTTVTYSGYTNSYDTELENTAGRATASVHRLHTSSGSTGNVDATCTAAINCLAQHCALSPAAAASTSTPQGLQGFHKGFNPQRSTRLGGELEG